MKKILMLLFLISNLSYGEAAYIASFNTLHLGWSGEKEYGKMAEFLDFFDIVALQEVMNEEGLEELIDTLNDETSSEWEYIISPHSLGSESYSEYYAFIWKADKVEKQDNGKFYDGEYQDKFKRKPFGVTFKIDEFDFTYISCHSVFGDSVSQRRGEALYLDEVYEYFQDFDENEQDILIGGDFNIPAYDEGFGDILSHKDQLYYGINPSNKTTIGKSELVSSYDNIFYSYKYTSEYTGNSGIIDFTNNDYEVVRKVVSDHLPVFMEVETSVDDD